MVGYHRISGDDRLAPKLLLPARDQLGRVLDHVLHGTTTAAIVPSSPMPLP